MEEIPISKFRATCLAVLRRVYRTQRPVRVTRLGEPLADIVPLPANVKPRKRWLGSMKGTMEIKGDIVAPSGSEEDWEAARK